MQQWIEFLIDLDRQLFLTLNALHVPWLDPVMVLISKTIFWLPLYSVLLFFIIKANARGWWVALICIAITVALTDQITSGIMKPYFARLRPSHDLILQHQVHTVNGYKGGQYGFASSHAANTFATAAFVFLLLGRSKPWGVALFAWSTLVSYSRIYLGVHFPGDIVVGAIIGIAVALAMFIVYIKIKPKILGSSQHNRMAS